jgi:peptidyl-prolyl cis-trans isomerase B (cyclophilin B)
MHTNAGAIELELFDDDAPKTVANFRKLASDGFYDGLTFHRIIRDFMIQGGCPQGTGTGGPGYTIAAEFNDTPHVRGVLSMARSQDPDSAGSQFFICHGDARFLDKQYTAFGRLTSGQEVLDKIAKAPTQKGGEGSKPVSPVKIQKVVVRRPKAG